MSEKITEVKEQNEKFKILESLGISLIKSMSEIQKIFSIESIYTDKPEIHTDNDCVILFDTPIYNSSYLTDLITEYVTTYDKLNYSKISKILNLDNKNITKEVEFTNELIGKIISQTKKTKIFYCQDEDVYVKLFESWIKKRFDSSKQVPVILTVKGSTQSKPKDIFIDIENIAPLNYNTVMKNMVLLYDYNQNF